jgi:hypothetical protein
MNKVVTTTPPVLVCVPAQELHYYTPKPMATEVQEKRTWSLQAPISVCGIEMPV